MNTRTHGIAGDDNESLIDGHFSIEMKARNVIEEQIAILPRNMKIEPSPLTIANLSACFKIKAKAFIAETQKLSDVNANYM
jgi:hypothetical protein